MLSMHTSRLSLTEGIDFYVKGPLVAGYPVAEWLARNWWRLRWEGRLKASDWAAAHVMASIGDGYVWPNIEIGSDGVRTPS